MRWLLVWVFHTCRVLSLISLQIHLVSVFIADLLITLGTSYTLRKRSTGLTTWIPSMRTLCLLTFFKVPFLSSIGCFEWCLRVPYLQRYRLLPMFEWARILISFVKIMATIDLILTQTLGKQLLWHLFVNFSYVTSLHAFARLLTSYWWHQDWARYMSSVSFIP